MRNGHWIYPVCLLACMLAANSTLWCQQPEELSNKFVALKNKLQTEVDWQNWKAFILPDESDKKWMQTPWLATFGEGIAEAAKTDKPILLWTMNGHPLGCT